MQLQRQSDGKIITLNPASKLGRGGEAQVYAVPHESGLVAKVYHQPSDERAHKLAAMLASPPENANARGITRIAWPVDLLCDSGRRVVGFLMPRVNETRPIADFYNPGIRRRHNPLFTYEYLHNTARNLAAAVKALHARGYVIGDVNESNILVATTTIVTLVDTDSFQVSANGTVFRCPVGKPEFTPPELQGQTFAQLDRAPEHDLFGLGALIFQLLMEGTHPFLGIFQGRGDPPPLEARIQAGHFPYGTKRNIPWQPTKIAPPIELLHPALRQLFVQCFEDGHRRPQARPDAQTWQSALQEARQALVTCTSNEQHRYGNHLQSCPWCERARLLGGRDPFPSPQVVARGEHLAKAKKPTATRTPPTPAAPPPKVAPPPPPMTPVATAAPRSAKQGAFIFVGLLLLLFVFMFGFYRYNSPLSSNPTAALSSAASSATIDSSKMASLFGDSNFARIPAGEFQMGSENDSDEQPVHRVKISRDFEMGKCEVTQAQWQAVMGDNPSSFKGDNLPVEEVSWNDVQEFIRKLNQGDSKYQYRLPTEAEWEYACRAGTTGDYAGDLDAMAWYGSNSNNQTHPVGQKQANKWGLYDMHGNVWEWCQDWYDSNYYGQSPGADPTGPTAGSYRVYRGGGWLSTAASCRSAIRFSISPGDRRYVLGFRLLRTAR
jgi:formylglycine-generating enzyme required for sulfatase activity